MELLSEVVGLGVVLKYLTIQRQLYNNEKADPSNASLSSTGKSSLITATNKILEYWTRSDKLLLLGGLVKRTIRNKNSVY